MALIRFMTWASLALGRPVSRALLALITAYFLATGRGARRAAREFLARSLGRIPTLADQYRLFFAFASTVHDRIYFLKGRFDLFEIEVNGAAHLDGAGALLMGAHLGSFDALRACGRHLGRREVTMAMYEDNAHKVNAVLAAIEPQAGRDIVALGHAGSMLELAERLDSGALVGMLCDRTLGQEAVVRLPFLGREAAFPIGPMRVAAALRRRVIFMAGLYRGDNRYALHFEPLADFGDAGEATREERDERVREAVARYAQRVEHHARSAPYNWFNFHDFWGSGA